MITPHEQSLAVKLGTGSSEAALGPVNVRKAPPPSSSPRSASALPASHPASERGRLENLIDRLFNFLRVSLTSNSLALRSWSCCLIWDLQPSSMGLSALIVRRVVILVCMARQLVCSAATPLTSVAQIPETSVASCRGAAECLPSHRPHSESGALPWRAHFALCQPPSVQRLQSARDNEAGLSSIKDAILMMVAV